MTMQHRISVAFLALVLAVTACAGDPVTPASVAATPEAGAATAPSDTTTGTSHLRRWAGEPVAVTTDGGQTITFSITEGQCPADYETEAVEEAQQVTIAVHETFAADCPDNPDSVDDRVGPEKVLVVNLAAPLGTRALVDAASGREAHVVDASVALRPAILPAGWEASKFMFDDAAGVAETFGPVGDTNDVPAIMVQVRPVIEARDLLAGLRSRKPEFFREIDVRGGTANAVRVQHKDPGRVILGFVEDGYSYRFVRRADIDDAVFLTFIEDLAAPG